MRGKRSWSVVALAICWAVISTTLAESPAPGKQVASSATVKVKADDGEREAKVRFLIALPADYDKEPAKKWPLVLFLHGSGEKGEDIEKVKIHGPPKLAAAGREFPFVLVSPQCEPNTRWNAQELAALVDQLEKDYRLDPQRLCVTGLSMGGAGTWSLITAYPNKFAAAMPLCGRGELEAVEKLTKIPVWVLVGEKDSERTVQNCKEMVAELKKAGGTAKLTLYPELGHDCWTVTYQSPEVYDWLLAQRLPTK